MHRYLGFNQRHHRFPGRMFSWRSVKTLCILAGMLLSVAGMARAENLNPIKPRLSVTAGQLFFTQTPAKSRYGSVTLVGLRLGLDTRHAVQPFLGVDYGREYAEYPYRVTTLRVGPGLHVRVVEVSSFRVYAGGSLLVCPSSERFTYSPCMPGHEMTRDFEYTAWTCQLLGGLEWFPVSRGISVSMEVAYAPSYRSPRTSTADPPHLSLSGSLVGVRLTADLFR